MIFLKTFVSIFEETLQAADFFFVVSKSLDVALSDGTGSAITNGREPRRSLGRAFNSKLGCIATPGSKFMVCMQPLLKLKTRPKAGPVS